MADILYELLLDVRKGFHKVLSSHIVDISSAVPTLVPLALGEFRRSEEEDIRCLAARCLLLFLQKKTTLGVEALADAGFSERTLGSLMREKLTLAENGAMTTQTILQIMAAVKEEPVDARIATSILGTWRGNECVAAEVAVMDWLEPHAMNKTTDLIAEVFYRTASTSTAVRESAVRWLTKLKMPRHSRSESRALCAALNEIVPMWVRLGRDSEAKRLTSICRAISIFLSLTHPSPVFKPGEHSKENPLGKALVEDVLNLAKRGAKTDPALALVFFEAWATMIDCMASDTKQWPAYGNAYADVMATPYASLMWAHSSAEVKALAARGVLSLIYKLASAASTKGRGFEKVWPKLGAETFAAACTVDSESAKVQMQLIPLVDTFFPVLEATILALCTKDDIIEIALWQAYVAALFSSSKYSSDAACCAALTNPRLLLALLDTALGAGALSCTRLVDKVPLVSKSSLRTIGTALGENCTANEIRSALFEIVRFDLGLELWEAACSSVRQKNEALLTVWPLEVLSLKNQSEQVFPDNAVRFLAKTTSSATSARPVIAVLIAALTSESNTTRTAGLAFVRAIPPSILDATALTQVLKTLLVPKRRLEKAAVEVAERCIDAFPNDFDVAAACAAAVTDTARHVLSKVSTAHTRDITIKHLAVSIVEAVNTATHKTSNLSQTALDNAAPFLTMALLCTEPRLQAASRSASACLRDLASKNMRLHLDPQLLIALKRTVENNTEDVKQSIPYNRKRPRSSPLSRTPLDHISLANNISSSVDGQSTYSKKKTTTLSDLAPPDQQDNDDDYSFLHQASQRDDYIPPYLLFRDNTSTL